MRPDDNNENTRVDSYVASVTRSFRPKKRGPRVNFTTKHNMHVSSSLMGAGSACNQESI